MWLFFANAMSLASQSTVANAQLISKVYFPRVIIPIAAVIQPAFDFCLALLVVFAALAVYNVEIGPQILLLPLLMPLALGVALGLGLWLSALHVKYRDVQVVVPFVVQVGLFITPILYPFDLVPENLQPIYALNPMVGVLELYRWMLFDGSDWPGAIVLIPFGSRDRAARHRRAVLPARRAQLRGHDLRPLNDTVAIAVDHVGKSYRLGAGDGPSGLLSERIGARAAGPVRRASQRAGRARGVLGAAGRLARGRAGRGGRPDRRQRRRQEHAAEAACADHRTHRAAASRCAAGWRPCSRSAPASTPSSPGRENIYLNGSILGMRRAEIDAKLDEIVAFSGVEQFIDTPVKRYSSGMYVRLAFAVGAHLEPEILLVDEVLAVGDADFQRKCLGKMRDVVDDEGRTIIFVSHNLSAIQRLCERSIWLDDGVVAADGLSRDVVAAYLKQVGSHQQGGVAEVGDDVPRVGTGDARLRRVELVTADGEPLESVLLGQPFGLRLEFEVVRPLEEGVVELGLSGADGTRAVTVQNIDRGGPALELEPGTWTVEATIDTTLLPGDFNVDVGFHRRSGLTWDYVEQVLTFVALNVAAEGDDRYPWNVVRGFVRAPTEWTVRAADPATQPPA